MHRLFNFADLDYSRDAGVAWHTLRHEFCSRTAENTGDPVVAQELARRKDLRTTQTSPHARRSRVLTGAVSRNRRPLSEPTSWIISERNRSAPRISALIRWWSGSGGTGRRPGGHALSTLRLATSGVMVGVVVED